MNTFKKLITTILISSTLFSITSKAETTPTLDDVVQQLDAQEDVVAFNHSWRCLTENIYYEAGNQSYTGKLAVAQVVMNRVKSGKFRNDVCGVIYQKDRINGYAVCQFSWVCTSVTALLRNKYQWEESSNAAYQALTEPYVQEVLYKENALYYHANYANPGWNLRRVIQIGAHIFYREK